MGGLIYNLGRGVGHATIPLIRKSKLVWRALAGDDAAAIAAEGEFGRSMAAQLRLKTGVSHEPGDLALVREIGTRLSACVRKKERTFQFEVLRDAAVTALALPGGFIFVSAPLLNECERNADELAFVLGHEMGHVVRGHAMERALTRIGAEGLSTILSRGLLNPALREAGLDWLQRSHAKEAEMEADEFAVRVSRAAGFDPAAGLNWLKR